jgi:hypothetical protein
MGGHSLSVADVDADGKDEIVYQAMTVDDNGVGLYSTGRRHGDSMHISDFYPDRPGLELFLISENENETVRFQTPGVGVHDARTGNPIWTHSPGVDVGQGMMADIDPRHRGAEAWGGPGGLRNARGEEIGPKPRSDYLGHLVGRRFAPRTFRRLLPSPNGTGKPARKSASSHPKDAVLGLGRILQATFLGTGARRSLSPRRIANPSASTPRPSQPNTGFTP